jgi:hypothetical protein
MTILATKTSHPTIEAVLRDVWTERLRGYTNLEFRWRESVPYVFAWRAQGDIYRYAQEPVDRFMLTSAGTTIQAFNIAIDAALKALPPLTVSEALEAGERRRLARR